MLGGLHHPNVLPCIGVVLTASGEPQYLLTPRARGGTLHGWIHGEDRAGARGPRTAAAPRGLLPLGTQLRALEGVFAAGGVTPMPCTVGGGGSSSGPS